MVTIMFRNHIVEYRIIKTVGNHQKPIFGTKKIAICGLIWVLFAQTNYLAKTYVHECICVYILYIYVYLYVYTYHFMYVWVIPSAYTILYFLLPMLYPLVTPPQR